MDFYGLSPSMDMVYELRSCETQTAREKFIKWFNSDQYYDLVRAKRNELMGDKLEHAPLKENAKEVLINLSKTYDLYIVSATATTRINKYLKECGLDKYFKDVVSAKDAPRGKPYPDVYYSVSSKLGIPTNEILVIEDSPNGIEAAYQAGCQVIMIEDMTKATPDILTKVQYVVTNFKELEKILTL